MRSAADKTRRPQHADDLSVRADPATATDSRSERLETRPIDRQEDRKRELTQRSFYAHQDLREGIARHDVAIAQGRLGHQAEVRQSRSRRP